jgi:uncharacterized membrane protein
MRYRSTDLVLAAAFGWLTGMRSMAGPAVAGRKLLRNYHARNALAVGAIGEMIADKHPATPNRNAREPLAVRTVAGAATGAMIMISGSGWRTDLPFRTRRRMHHLDDAELVQSAMVGAMVGGATAFISTHVSYHVRRKLSEKTKASNVVLGMAEDAVVYGAATGFSTLM